MIDGWMVCSDCGNDYHGGDVCPVCGGRNTYLIDGLSDGEAFPPNDCCGDCVLPDTRMFE